jgi:hypothetical protein
MVKIGERLRCTLELPWFSVWADFDPMVIACYRTDRNDFAEMIVHELEDAAYRAIQEDVHRALKVARDIETAFTIPSTSIPREVLEADARET